MTLRRILATSGGFVPGPTQRTVRPGRMVLDALSATGKLRPTVTLVLTASGDGDDYYHMLYECFCSVGCDVNELRVYLQPSAPPAERLAQSDFVWVGGGSVANLLALWRLHDVDVAMREAWENGVVLAGVSAGSLCWHSGGTTDSFGPELRPVTNTLGLLPYANGVHYDSESQRRPLLHDLLKRQILGPVAYATDDHVGLWYEDTELVAIVSDSEVDRVHGPAGYRVEYTRGEVLETRLGVGVPIT